MIIIISNLKPYNCSNYLKLYNWVQSIRIIMEYLKSYNCVRTNQEKKERERDLFTFYGILIPYGLFNAEMEFSGKRFIVIAIIFSISKYIF